MGKKRTSVMENGPKLLIVESPAKIKTISKFLGSDFKIMSTFGHIKDLPTRKLGITIDEKTNKITLEYVPIKDKATVIADICKQARKSSEIYLASDPDREGEIISWHIGQEIEKVFADEAKIHRITFNEITAPAIKQAIEDKTTVDLNQVSAQQARRILDRWVGYEVSPILWKKIAKGLSAGRVQSVAVLLICQRDEEIVNFKPEESWSVQGIFEISKAKLPADLFKISGKNIAIKNKEDADKVLAEIKKEKDFVVTKITDKQRSKNALPPFMTSTLQQDAYNKLGFSVDRTMAVAQQLYEGVPLSKSDSPEALITYMRTDSLRISDTALKAVRGYIKKEFGDKYLPKAANFYGKKGAQDAHEAIRPISIEITPEMAARYLKPHQAKLYELIWKRFVACQMTPAEYFQRQVLIDSGKYTFKATGSTLIFDGFLKVYLVEEEEGSEEKTTNIPKEIEENKKLDLKDATNKQHFTQPPPRYTEASLVKELEKRGIGRPSTYAATLSTIQKRSYVEKDPKKKFLPTELGKAVNEMLVKNLPDIINITFTAKMEEDLDKIAQGEVDRDTVLHEFYGKFKKDLVEFGGAEATRRNVETDLKCPTCQNPLVIRFGKSGEFLGCSKFPECKFTANVMRDEQGNVQISTEEANAEIIDIKCPNCGKNLVKKVGRFGPFLACPGYPECKYIHQEQLKMRCPQCNGNLAKRRWKGGSFWGCTGYPKCRFSIFGEVVEKPCPKCKAPYLLVTRSKDGKETHTCPNKECGHTE
ncbi:type I DNA topoisomerase [Candidatus Babeliales bacterium]|nr:type I DNA topoisomerase [Candidatus Babeliales bacterium]